MREIQPTFQRRSNMDKASKQAHKPLRSAITDIDQEILRLLLRRTNLLNKIKSHGRLAAEDEKFLREAWQNDVARVSRDPELSGRFFSLMQQIEFLPKPAENDNGTEPKPGAQRREAFNLAPSRKPVNIAMTAPLSAWQTTAWLYLAALCGQPLRLSPCLQNDALVDYVRGLAQIGAAITREGDAILCRPHIPLEAPDKVIHAGQSEFGLFIFIAHYIGRPARVKITGDAKLQLANLSALGRFLPQLGARLINIVPRSSGLPIRIEASGVLPPGIKVAPDLPSEFVEALLLAAPGYGVPFAVDLSDRLDSENILAHALPLLEASGAIFSLGEYAISFAPSELVIPKAPELAADPEISAFLLAYPFTLGGKARLKGKWPNWPELATLQDVLAKCGINTNGSHLEATCAKPGQSFLADGNSSLSEWQIPLTAALAACACLNGGMGQLPSKLGENTEVCDFLKMAGLSLSSDGKIEPCPKHDGFAWTAPSAAWALALALAACCRKGPEGFQLGNPGIVTELWPFFWGFYNSLPDPKIKSTPPAQAPAKQARRRIITNVNAILPEAREEDSD